MVGVGASVIASRVDRVLVGLQWIDPTRNLDERLWQLLTMRGGSIMAMQDYGGRSRALKAMR